MASTTLVSPVVVALQLIFAQFIVISLAQLQRLAADSLLDNLDHHAAMNGQQFLNVAKLSEKRMQINTMWIMI